MNNLVVQFGRARVSIDLASRVKFFHGKMAAGKTTIAKLIDACLGGSIPQTPAMKREFVSVQLNATIGSYDVLFERSAGSNQVQVTWVDANNQGATVLAPIDNAPSPIWGESVYGLSDLIFELAGIGPMRVRRNKTDPDAPLIPLSFRDVMWYCYLDQDELDSTFFHLENDDPRNPKSRDVMRFVLGYYTELLNKMEQQLAFETDSHKTKMESSAQLRKFFASLGYETELEISSEIQRVEVEKAELTLRLQMLRESHSASTHFTDDLRQELRRLSQEVDHERQALSDVEVFLSNEKELRSELLATKFKLNRLESATVVLSGVDFERCPQCGNDVSHRSVSDGACRLCGSQVANTAGAEQIQVNSAQRDLDARIVEIEESIKVRERARRKQIRRFEQLQDRKRSLDDQLTIELRTYDSAFLSQVRNVERSIASADERLINLRRNARIPQELRKLETEADNHLTKARQLRRDIADEKQKLAARDNLVERLEKYFYDALYTVGFPNITRHDRIYINRRTWVAFILPDGDESLAYTFWGAGSGGKKTLFNVCYALAIHRLAEEFDLPLPRFLIIDSPMKNIGTEVNKDVFLALYRYLYELASRELRGTQFIIIDTELARPTIKLDFSDRLMIPGSTEYPPLIPYYSGH